MEKEQLLMYWAQELARKLKLQGEQVLDLSPIIEILSAVYTVGWNAGKDAAGLQKQLEGESDGEEKSDI